MSIIGKPNDMKMLRAIAIAAALMASAITAWAETATIVGQVVKIDKAAGKITIKHGPLKEFGMDEAMTMVYRARDPAMLATVNAGDQIKFVADRVNGQFTVTRIEKQ
jgi:Cu(I)/Ag(I) efflux system periplasmic protein CusF